MTAPTRATDQPTPDQPRLVPDEPVVLGPIETLDLDEIQGYAYAKPDAALLRSVKEFGVLTPVLVRQQQNGFYRLLAGRRRCMAAVQADHTTIPAIVVTGADDPVLTLVENANRSANPLAELEAIEQLITEGATEQEIARATGMAIGAIRERLKMRNLHPILAQAALAGDIAIGVARAAARLPIDRQDDLVAVYHDAGKLTASHVHDAKTVQTTALGDTLFAALGVDALPLGDAEPAPDAWRPILLARLDALFDGLPEMPYGVAYHFKLLRHEVETISAQREVAPPDPKPKPKRAPRRSPSGSEA